MRGPASPASLGANGRQGFDERLAILIFLEDGFAAVAAVEDVIDCTGILDAKFAGHAGEGASQPSLVNSQN